MECKSNKNLSEDKAFDRFFLYCGIERIILINYSITVKL